MQYRTDIKTGNQLSILGFGCMRFPRNLGSIDMQKTEQLILKAIEHGVNYFDTAYIYPGSEKALGQILMKHNLREQVFLSTKLPLIQCRNRDDFDKFFYQQLERLKTTYIDYYFLHMLEEMSIWQRLCEWGIEEWLQEKKAKGEIRQIGFSYHGMRDEFLHIIDAYPWDFCLIQYNYSDENYQAGVTGLKRASGKGMSVFIMEPLLGGKLANGLPNQAVNLLKQSSYNYSPAAWAFRWLWNQPEVTVVLSGMNEMTQLEDNLKTADISTPNMLTNEEKEILNQVINIFNESYKVHCTGCNYCMPCPKGVNIPACFAAYNTSYSFGRFTALLSYFSSTGATTSQSHTASQCVKCGKCEKHCPQNIKIIKSLEDVSKRMEPFWFKGASFIIRKFFGAGSKKTESNHAGLK